MDKFIHKLIPRLSLAAILFGIFGMIGFMTEIGHGGEWGLLPSAVLFGSGLIALTLYNRKS